MKPLKGNFAGYYRDRIGEYHVIYRIDDETNQLIVTTIAHRREVYE
ncbi:MAG: type II toxin-antitoxin system RelE/ParE family toxin [Nostoc sp.]